VTPSATGALAGVPANFLVQLQAFYDPCFR